MANSIVYGNKRGGQPGRRRRAAPVAKPVQAAPCLRSRRTLLKCRPADAPGVMRVPFVALDSNEETSAPHWHVPATGGYIGGVKTGAAMATAFLKHQREQAFQNDDLAEIVRSFMRRHEEEGGRDMEARPASEQSDSFRSFRGQFAGFFGVLSTWLTGAAISEHLGECLDKFTERQLVDDANAGLCFDEKTYNSLLADGEEKPWQPI